MPEPRPRHPGDALADALRNAYTTEHLTGLHERLIEELGDDSEREDPLGRLVDALFAARHQAPPPALGSPRRAQEGDRIEDGGVMGTLVRCRECGGGGLLHRPDVMPPALQPQEATELPSSCPETVWDGPYAMRCGQGALAGVCATHGRFRPAERQG